MTSYTALSLAAVAAAVVADHWLLRTRLTSSSAWWLAYAIILVFQLITNGWLTGRGIAVTVGECGFDTAGCCGEAGP